MNYLRSSFAALTASLLAAHGLQAQTTATTDPVGFMTVTLPLGSDTVVAAPLTKPPVFQGAVSSRSNFVITVSPSPNFSNLAATPHYVQPVSGSQAGILFDVLTNNSNSITLVDNGIVPTGLDASNTFKVVPYWTLGELFPLADQNVSFTPSLSVSSSPAARRTTVLLPDIAGSGINRSPSSTYFFLTNASWRNVTNTAVNANGTPIPPDTYFIVRNPTNAATGQLTVAGNVNTGAMTVQLDRLTNSQNDNYVSVSRPVDMTLDQLGLITSGAFVASSGPSSSPLVRRDQLLTFNNADIAFNKSPAATYFYISNAGTNEWRSTTGATNAGGTVIPAGIGLVIRKATNSPATSQFWTNTITIAP